MLGCAVKNGAVARNVAAVHAAPAVEGQEIEVLTTEQIAAVLAKLAGHALYPIVALALATGMRRGELLALQWGDVDLDASTLRVERSVEETRAGLRLKPPKTKRGRRNIALPTETVAMLRAHKVLLLLTDCRGSRFTRCGTPTCPRLSMPAWTSSPLADASDTRRRLLRLTFTATSSAGAIKPPRLRWREC